MAAMTESAGRMEAPQSASCVTAGAAHQECLLGRWRRRCAGLVMRVPSLALLHSLRALCQLCRSLLGSCRLLCGCACGRADVGARAAVDAGCHLALHHAPSSQAFHHPDITECSVLVSCSDNQLAAAKGRSVGVIGLSVCIVCEC